MNRTYIHDGKTANIFTKLPKFLHEYDLNPTEKVTYSILLGYNGPDGCFPSLRTMANTIGRSPSAICRAIDNLVSVGLLYRTKKESSNGHLKNIYTIPFVNSQPNDKDIFTRLEVGFIRIPTGGVFATLKPREKIVLGELLHCNGKRGCFPKLKTMAKRTSISKSSISESIKVLEEKGIIYVKRTGRANEYTFNRKHFFSLQNPESESGIPEQTLQKRKRSRLNLDSYVQHSRVSDRETQVFGKKGSPVEGRKQGGKEKNETDLHESGKVFLNDASNQPENSFSTASLEAEPVVENEAKKDESLNNSPRPDEPLAKEITEEQKSQALEVFEDFKNAMHVKGLHIPYGIKNYEIQQVVGIIGEIGFVDTCRLMHYAVSEWEVLSISTGSDGKKLLSIPNFNQIVAYWRPRIWSARMLGKTSKRKKKVDQKTRERNAVRDDHRKMIEKVLSGKPKFTLDMFA